MARRRVVVTGVGHRSPLGNTSRDLLEGLTTGRSGLSRAPEWDWVKDLRTRVVGRAEALDPATLPRPLRRTAGRVGLLALAALEDALADSGLSKEEAAGEDSWLLVGSTLGALEDIDQMFVRLHRTASVLGTQSSETLRSMGHTAAITCALHLGFRGRLMAPSAACATGSLCVGLGYEAIQDGRAEIVLAGGADESQVSTAVLFDTLHAASEAFNDRPAAASRPFDARRDGIVCAEGAGFLVLESLERAEKRGARILGEVKGFATASSGVAATTPDGEAISRCMRACLRDGSISPADVTWVNAHATGTLAGDSVESQAIGSVLGARVPVSSPKGHLGHTMAAAGAIETIICLLHLERGLIHPTLNLEEVAADCVGVDHVVAVREGAHRVVLNNNFALGGIHTCLALGKP
jgi:3-oxoacyl-[acyl-carrier-protein] synthase II